MDQKNVQLGTSGHIQTRLRPDRLSSISPPAGHTSHAVHRLPRAVPSLAPGFVSLMAVCLILRPATEADLNMQPFIRASMPALANATTRGSTLKSSSLAGLLARQP